jgi:hypothetical protein
LKERHQAPLPVWVNDCLTDNIRTDESRNSKGQLPLARAGFFHFGSGEKGDPVRSLVTELDKQNYLEDCLLVLPEAFNVPGGYYSECEPSGKIIEQLSQSSSKYGVAFVVGLIDHGEKPEKRYNSACLIDGTVQTVITKKQSCGNSNLYQKYPHSCDAPLVHRDLGIAALVCMDATTPVLEPERRQLLVDRIVKLGARRNLLCIPSHMGTNFTKPVVERWAELSVVLANASPSPDRPSVIRTASGLFCSDGMRFSENQIRIEGLA